MRKLILALGLCSVLAAQTAKFPTAVATDDQLKVVRNRVQSSLIADVNVGDNVLIVKNGAGFVANMLVTIDDQSGTTEIVSVCAANGNILTIGSTGSCPDVAGRGTDGTTPIAHSTGALVSAFVDAWHHNALTAEVKAIETALGASMANVARSGVNNDITQMTGLVSPLVVGSGGTGASSAAAARANLGAAGAADNVNWTGAQNSSGATQTAPNRVGTVDPATCDATKAETFYNTTTKTLKVCSVTNTWSSASSSGISLNSDLFDFPAQSPGVDLTAGSTTITLSPVPQGLNWNDPNNSHWLYASGGLDAAGICYIVSVGPGTATTGAASGTITVNCAAQHRGAYTLKSATAGIYEAVNSLPAASGPNYGGGTVDIPSGTKTTYATLVIARNYVRLRGQGTTSTAISTAYTGGPTILLDGPNTSGGVGIQNAIHSLSILGPGSAASNYGIVIDTQNSVLLRDVIVAGVAQGIDIKGANTFRAVLDNVNVSYLAANGRGILIEGGADHFLSRVNIANGATARAGIEITKSGGTWIHQSDVMQAGTGLLIDPSGGNSVGGIWVTDSAFDTCPANGVNIVPAAGSIANSIFLVNSWASSNADHGVLINGTGGSVYEVYLVGFRMLANGTKGLHISGGNGITVSSSEISGSSAAANGTYSSVLIDGSPANITLIGNRIGNALYGGACPGSGCTAYDGIQIQPGTDKLIATNNRIANFTNLAIEGAANTTNSIIKDNIGYNPVGQSTITVGASPYTYTAGPTPETIYIYSGTVSDIKRGATTVASASPAQILVPPNGTVVVTYSAAPTMKKDVQ